MKDSENSEDSIEKAGRRFLLYVLLPFWFIPGIGDYLWHRKTKIEETSGTHESLTHSLMMALLGGPTMMGFFFEADAGLIAMMMAAALAHEAVVLWDVAYATGRRETPPGEQHMHSFLEVLPFTQVAFVACLHPKQTAALFGRGDEKPRWKLRFKPRAPVGYIIGMTMAITLFVGLPYAEEFVRCYRHDHTLAPHPLPDESTPSEAA